MARMMKKWTGRLFAALAAAAFAVLAYEYAGEDVSAEASGAAREFMFAGGGVTNRLAGTEADMAAVQALHSEEAAAAMAEPRFPHVAPPLRDGLDPLAALAVFDSDALLYYAYSSNIVNNVVLDESTNGCDGVATGCSWLQTGRFNGGALEFFGNSSEVNAGTGLDFPSWSQYSVSLWFLHDGGGDMGPQYGHKMLDKTSFYHDWHIALMPTGASAGSIGLSMYEGGTHLGMGDPSGYYMDGEWHHVAVVRDGSRGEFWVDGELVVETNAMFSVYSQSALCVGNSYSADYYQQKGWSGVIDEVRVFDRPLATNEIVSLYLEGTMSPVALMDYDGDGMPNGWEIENNLDPTDPSDAYADADYDSLSNLNEFILGTDPNNPDTDGDGVPDAAELVQGTDPLEWGDTPEQPPYEVSSNSIPWTIRAWSLAPGAFALCGVQANSNLFERTITVDRTSPWQQLFISSRPDGPGGWRAGDVEISVDFAGLDYSPNGVVFNNMDDSWRVPLGTGAVQTVTFSIRATGPSPFLDRPLYLLRWTADVAVYDDCHSNAVAVALSDSAGVKRAFAVRRARSGRFELPFVTDRSTMPMYFKYDTGMEEQLVMPPNDSFRVEFMDEETTPSIATGYTPRRFVADSPSTAQLPPAGTNDPARVFFYELDVEWPDPVEAGPRASQFDAPYPLNSPSLRSAFHEAKENAPGSAVAVSIRPHDPDVRLGNGAGASTLVESLALSAPGVAVPFFCGLPDWDGRFELEDPPPEDYPGEVNTYDDDIDEGGGPGDCGCADAEDGPSFGSPLGLRVSLGEPGEGLHSGYLWTSLDGARGVTPSSFSILAASPISSTTNGVGFTVTCLAPDGRTLSVTNIANGAAVAVFNASGREECRWEVWNPSGSASQVRVRRVTVAGNFTLDETYDLASAPPSGPQGTRIAGVAADETMERVDSLTGVRTRIARWRTDEANPEFVTDELDETYAPDGTLVASLRREFGMVGVGDAAVRRETLRTGNDVEGSVEESRAWVCDASNRQRHGLLRSVRSNRRSWALYDYDPFGRETVRMEQLDGSQFPEGLDVPSLWADLSPYSAAKITLTFYDPPDGDSAHPNDWNLPRRRETYVRQRLYEGGVAIGVDAPVLVAEEAWTYTRGQDASGVPVRRCVHVKGLDEEVRTDETVAYPDDAAVPQHLRGLSVSSIDHDGITTTNEYAVAGGLLTTTTRRFGPASLSAQPAQRPTYAVSVTDAAHRLPLRDEMRLTADDAVLEWSERAYDDIRRLRSVRHSDGTWETNAYSCCRLLWSRGRDGRKTLRSARTGSDMLYHADEDVWMLDVLGSPLSRSWGEAFRVTRHFFDAFGRETNTTAFVTCEPGEGTLPPGPEDDAGDFLESVEYPGGSSSQRIALDGRGRKELSWTCRYDDHEYGDGYAGPAEELSDPTDPYGPHVRITQTFSWRGGRTESHDGGGSMEWLESHRGTRWDDDGLRRDVDMWLADRSWQNLIAVTNSVTVHDALGRVAATETPLGVTSNFYDGASSRLLRAVTTSSANGRAFMTGSPVVRTVEYIYDEMGERVGSVQDGVTNRTEVSYAFDGNVYWRVTTRSVVGPSTNSVTTTREQLTGLSDALRSRTISVNADGVATTNSVSYNPNTLVETSTTSSPAFGTRVARGVCGLVLEEETADETIAHIYDPHGREERTDRRASGEADFRTVAEFVYNAMGDMVERRTYTNATDYVTERFAYDHEGREIASTNSLGGVVTTSYDPRGNVVAVDGATYPLRMEYDLRGRRTSLKTTRDGENWDTTRWTLDPATGLCLSKTYADNSTVSYTYTPDGLPARTTWPGGRWQENGYSAKREIVSTERSDGEETSSAYDAYSRETAVTNDSASIEYARDDRGRATNVTTTVAGEVHSLAREFDAAGRLSRAGDLFYGYDAEGRLSIVSNASVAVEYQYAADGLDAGYSLTLPSGAVFTRSVTRDALRRSLVTGIANSFSGNTVESIAYSYDALGRPVVRNADAFGYNDRGEVTAASIMGWSPSPSTASYGYDVIGNLQQSTFNAATNTYTANCLNQYTSIQEISAPSASPREPTYDLDGNMLSDGVLSFTYDAASRLKTVSSNNVLLVTNFYDAKSRRVKKVTPNATTTFFYDDWNLVEERIAYADNATSTIRYYWGKDLSGTLQGAGGVGGLLYLTIDGVIYIPCYDNNGNITRYLNANGGTFARYSYDAFGKLIAKSGRRASFFRHRFSTKYYDSETGLYYYGYRFYHPTLMRWLNRDPIKEEGGVNLYGFCENKPIEYFDLFGMKIRSGVKPTKCSEADIDAAAKDVLLLAVRAMNADPPQSRLEHYGNLCCACKSGHYEVITTGPLSGEIQKSNGRKGTVRYIQETPVSDPRDPRISCPKGSTRVGYYHTHVYGDNFSKSDKELLYYQDHPYYMSRDGKRIVKAIPRITDDPAEANLPQDAVSDRGFALEPEVIILERGANE